MDLMKRFGQICHAEKLTYSKANYCTIFKQTIKSIHPDSLTIEKARFSTKRHRIVLATRVLWRPRRPFTFVFEGRKCKRNFIFPAPQFSRSTADYPAADPLWTTWASSQASC